MINAKDFWERVEKRKLASGFLRLDFPHGVVMPISHLPCHLNAELIDKWNTIQEWKESHKNE